MFRNKTVYIVDHDSDPRNIDLWPSQLKNIRDRTLTNQHVKYISSVIISSQENKGKPFLQKWFF